MDIPALIEQLSKLQLEQNKIIEQIAARVTATPTEPEDTIHIGDHVLLLTGGIGQHQVYQRRQSSSHRGY